MWYSMCPWAISAISYKKQRERKRSKKEEGQWMQKSGGVTDERKKENGGIKNGESETEE